MEEANSEYIEQLSGGNIEFRIKLVEILKRELPEEIKLYQNHLQNKDYLSAAASVHKLKHKISILGLDKSYYIAHQFEKNLRVCSTVLEFDFSNILVIMQDYVTKL